MKQVCRLCSLLAVLLAIHTVHTFAQQGWVKQESGSGSWLSDVFFVNGTTGMVVGESGLILRTTNGGATWTTSNAGVYETLLDIFMVNRDTAIAVGAGGLILRTTNGGNTWQQTRVDPYRWLYSVWFPRPALGIVVGESGAMFRSTDGGASWSYVNDPPMSYLSGVTLMGVAFADSLSGMVVGSMGTILRTTDGGGTWNSVNLTTSQSLMDVAFPDPDFATVVGEGGIRHTTDGGVTWEVQAAGTAWTPTGVSFADSATGLVTTNTGEILRTSDGGATWLTTLGGDPWYPGGVSLLPNDTATVVGSGGTILRTTTGGRVVTLLAPNGGEFWVRGTEQTIRWTSAGVVNVRIEQSSDDGNSWSAIADTQEADAAQYPWIVPDQEGAAYRIRISDVFPPLLRDVSDNAFTVTSAPSIAVSADSLSFELAEGDSGFASVTITNSGPGILSCDITEELFAGVPKPEPLSLLLPPERATASGSSANRDGGTGQPLPALTWSQPPDTLVDLTGVRVLLDQTHSYSDSSSPPLSSLIHDLRAAGATVKGTGGKLLSPELLADYDVIYANDPWNLLYTSELVAIQGFVNAGGGLVVLGGGNPIQTSYWTYFAGIEMFPLSMWLDHSALSTETPLHPVTLHVDTVSVGGNSYLTLTPPAVPLVRIKDTVFVAASTYGAGSVVASASNSPSWNYGMFDNRVLLMDAFAWVARKVPWLVSSHKKLILQPGTSGTIDLTILPGEIVPGLRRASLILSSNDPSKPEVIVPVTAKVTGISRISLSRDSLDFGETFLTYRDTLSVLLANKGSDTLRISGITSDNPAFSPLVNLPLAIPPRGRFGLAVQFAPTAVAEEMGQVTIASNDPDHPSTSLTVHGVGVPAPAIAVSADTLAFHLSMGEAGVQYLAITNSGQGPLRFWIDERVMFDESAWGSPDTAAHRDTIHVAVMRSMGTSQWTVNTWLSLLANQRYYGNRPVAIDYSSLSGASVTAAQIAATGADVLLISNASGMEDAWRLQQSEMDALAASVDSGRGLIVTSGTLNTATVPAHNRLAPLLGLDSTVAYRWERPGEITSTWVNSFVLTSHPVFHTMYSPYWLGWNRSTAVSAGWHTALKQAQLIARAEPADSGAISVYRNRIYFSTMPEGPNSYTENLLLYNAMVWAGSLIQWIRAEQTEGLVSPGETIQIPIEASTNRLSCGKTTNAVLRIGSNDPAHPFLDVPARLTVTSAPFLSLETDTLTFAESYAGFADTLALIMRNSGCDVLQILGASSTDPAFSVVGSPSMTIPGDSAGILRVRFAPPDPGIHEATLSISTGNPLQPVMPVALIGRAFLPPVAGLKTGTLSFALHGNDTVHTSVTITNSGAGELRFRVSERPPQGDTLEVIGGGGTPVGAGTNYIHGNIYRAWGGKLPQPLHGFSIGALCNFVAPPVELRFVVYEATSVTGPFTKLFERSSWVTTSSYVVVSSGQMDVQLQEGKYYFVGVAHGQAISLARASASLPLPTAFGSVEYAAGINAYPPPASATPVSYLRSLVWTQELTTGWLLATNILPDSGSVAPGDSTVVLLTFRAPVTEGEYESLLLVTTNDPARRTISALVTLDVLTGVEDVTSLPGQFALMQNYPNPFNPSTTIRYALPVASRVSLKVYNMLGQEVVTLVEGYQEAGYKSALFDAAGLASGVYIYRLSAGQFTASRKLVVVK